MLYTWQAGDCSDQEPYNGDFDAAMKGIKAKALVLPGKTDLYFRMRPAPKLQIDACSDIIFQQHPRTLKLRSNTCGQVLDGAYHFLRSGAIGPEVTFVHSGRWRW